MSVLSFLFQTGDWRITEGLRTIQYLYRTAHRPQLCSVSMAPAAVAKPHAVYVLQGGTAAKYDMDRLRIIFTLQLCRTTH